MTTANQSVRRMVLTFALAGAVCGCAPGIDNSLSVSQVGTGSASGGHALIESSHRARVGGFIDARGSDDIGEIDGKALAPSGDIAQSVQKAVEQELRNAGVRVSLFDAPMITGEVTMWRVSVNSGFPASRVRAQAQLKLRVLGIDNRAAYTGTYSGEVVAEHPLFSQQKIEEVLGDAMNQALKEAMSDERLMEKLAS